VLQWQGTRAAEDEGVHQQDTLSCLVREAGVAGTQASRPGLEKQGEANHADGLVGVAEREETNMATGVTARVAANPGKPLFVQLQ
jgi:hypothetical protein